MLGKPKLNSMHDKICSRRMQLTNKKATQRQDYRLWFTNWLIYLAIIYVKSGDYHSMAICEDFSTLALKNGFRKWGHTQWTNTDDCHKLRSAETKYRQPDGNYSTICSIENQKKKTPLEEMNRKYAATGILVSVVHMTSHTTEWVLKKAYVWN